MNKTNTVRDIMSSRLCTCTPCESIKDAARLMDAYDIGCVAVCDPNGTCTGVVTDRDIVIRCHSKDKDAKSTTVREVMTASPEKITPDTTVDEAIRIMGAKQVRRLPVEENGKLVGMVSLGDIARSCHCDMEIGVCECSIADDHCGCSSPKNMH
ncbi:MAG: CBS domain-containing protein [Clostridia bacterium]|nr:CBS domain-containing protein [Clostridia bacterium]